MREMDRALGIDGKAKNGEYRAPRFAAVGKSI